MKITWIGHACFKVENENYSVVLDPFTDGSVPGIGPVRETANAVFCSHGHGDHNAADLVTIVEAEGPAFEVQILDTYHDEVQGAKRGPNKITILSDGTTKVAHMGDLGCELTEEQKEALQGLDVLMIPVGGFFTIDAAQAAAIVKELQPKTVIPMHYRSDSFGYEVIGMVDPFVQEMGSAEFLESPVFDTARNTVAMVQVLEPQNQQ